MHNSIAILQDTEGNLSLSTHPQGGSPSKGATVKRVTLKKGNSFEWKTDSCLLQYSSLSLTLSSSGPFFDFSQMG